MSGYPFPVIDIGGETPDGNRHTLYTIRQNVTLVYTGKEEDESITMTFLRRTPLNDTFVVRTTGLLFDSNIVQIANSIGFIFYKGTADWMLPHENNDLLGRYDSEEGDLGEGPTGMRREVFMLYVQSLSNPLNWKEQERLMDTEHIATPPQSPKRRLYLNNKLRF